VPHRPPLQECRAAVADALDRFIALRARALASIAFARRWDGRRLIPRKAARTRSLLVGGSCPATRCMKRIAANRRAIVAGLRPRSAVPAMGPPRPRAAPAGRASRAAGTMRTRAPRRRRRPRGCSPRGRLPHSHRRGQVRGQFRRSAASRRHCHQIADDVHVSRPAWPGRRPESVRCDGWTGPVHRCRVQCRRRDLPAR